MKYNVTKRFKTDAGIVHEAGKEIEIADKVEASRYMRMMGCIKPVESESAPAPAASSTADNTVGTSDEKPARKKQS